MVGTFKCPYCGKRLFDIKAESTGTLETKCQKCDKVVVVKLENLDLEKGHKSINLRI